MDFFGDGSDGALNVVSGTSFLNLDNKYQYTTVNLSSGATITSSGSNGSVLYITATDSITIDGNINLTGRVTTGQNSWSVPIDEVSYLSPSVANGGGGGGGGLGEVGGSQGSGFGGGGAGLGMTIGSSTYKGGNGGAGGTPGGIGGASRTTVGAGSNGGTSAGGSGALIFTATGAHSGAGGNAYSVNGGDGVNGGTLGGGGGGGEAGYPGIHVVLRAPIITISGIITVSGTDGGTGGNGGRSYNGSSGYDGSIPNASGGGGGGGGNSGNLYIYHGGTYTNTGTVNLAGGAGGTGGVGYQAGTAGAAGASGSVFVFTEPLLTTESAENITGVSALLGGEVTDNGGSTINEQGVCYSTSANPTISDTHAAAGTTSGAFSLIVAGLTVSTSYHVRAYAKTSIGTFYGDDVTFTTSSESSFTGVSSFTGLSTLTIS